MTNEDHNTNGFIKMKILLVPWKDNLTCWQPTFSCIISQSASDINRWSSSKCLKISLLLCRLLSISFKNRFTSKSHDFTMRSVMASNYKQQNS